MKKFLLGISTLLLTLRLIFLLGDPRVYGVREASSKPAFAAFGGVVDGVYMLSNILVAPLNWLYDLLHAAIPSVHSAFFPSMEAADAVRQIGKWLASHPAFPCPEPLRALLCSPDPAIHFPGVIDWLALLTLALLWALSPAIEPAWRWIRNLFWNLFIETSFTRKKKPCISTPCKSAPAI